MGALAGSGEGLCLPRLTMTAPSAVLLLRHASSPCACSAHPLLLQDAQSLQRALSQLQEEVGAARKAQQEEQRLRLATEQQLAVAHDQLQHMTGELVEAQASAPSALGRLFWRLEAGCAATPLCRATACCPPPLMLLRSSAAPPARAGGCGQPAAPAGG